MCPLRHLTLMQPGLPPVCQCNGIRHRLPSGMLIDKLSSSGEERSTIASLGAGSLKVVSHVVSVRFIIACLVFCPSTYELGVESGE